MTTDQYKPIVMDAPAHPLLSYAMDLRARVELDLGRYELLAKQIAELQAAVNQRGERIKDREAEITLIACNEARELKTTAEERAALIRSTLMADDGDDAWIVLTSNQAGDEARLLRMKAQLAAVELRIKTDRDYMRLLAGIGGAS